jgi:hypothetical protein
LDGGPHRPGCTRRHRQHPQASATDCAAACWLAWHRHDRQARARHPFPFMGALPVGRLPLRTAAPSCLEGAPPRAPVGVPAWSVCLPLERVTTRASPRPYGNHADQLGVALCFVSLSSLPRNWSRFPSSSVPLPALRCEAPRAGTDQGAAGLVQRALSSLVVSSGALRGVCSSPSPLLRCPVPIGNPRESGLARFASPSPSAAGLCTPPPRLRARDSCGVAPGAVHRGEFG